MAVFGTSGAVSFSIGGVLVDLWWVLVCVSPSVWNANVICTLVKMSNVA